MPTLSMVFGFRNRDLNRIKNCLDSLQHQTVNDFEVVFVDYGSDQAIAIQIQLLVESYTFCRYIYSDTRGYPWNRSHALNTGIRLSEGEYIGTSDIDMVFASDFIEKLLDEVLPNRVINALCYFTPNHFSDYDNLSQNQHLFTPSTKGSRGALICMSKKLYHDIGGFDEYYCYWGFEDTDIIERTINILGKENYWLECPILLYHQWHPPTSIVRNVKLAPRVYQIPHEIWQRFSLHYHHNRQVVVRNNGQWGQVVSSRDRPILQSIDFKKYQIKTDNYVLQSFRISDNYLTNLLMQAFYDLDDDELFVVINSLGKRKPDIASKIMFLMNRLLGHLDIEIDYSVNHIHNFIQTFIFDEMKKPPSKRLFRDYYLNFPANNGTTIILK